MYSGVERVDLAVARAGVLDGFKSFFFFSFLFGLMKMGPGWDQFLLDNLCFYVYDNHYGGVWDANN